MSSDFPTFSEIAEENIRGYLKRKQRGSNMKTVVFCKPEEFCMFCKETGGEYGVPLEFKCMAEGCKQPGTNCLFVQHGGNRE